MLRVICPVHFAEKVVWHYRMVLESTMEDTASTNTSLEDRDDDDDDEDDDDGGATRNALTDGLMGLLKPTIEQLDERVRVTRITQMELKQQIETLAEDLCKVSDAQNMPLDLEAYVKKLMNSKRRVMLVNNILQNAQERLNRVHQNLVRETAKRKSLLEPSAL